MLFRITGYILKTVANRIERGEQTNSFVVHPEDTRYVRNHREAHERVTLTVERKKDLTGHQFQPKQEKGDDSHDLTRP